MTEATVKQMIDQIISDLNRSEQLWDEKIESHAFIVGYLQGALRNLKSDLIFELPLEERRNFFEKK